MHPDNLDVLPSSTQTIPTHEVETIEKWFLKIEFSIIKALLLLDLVFVLGRIVFDHIYHL